MQEEKEEERKAANGPRESRQNKHQGKIIIDQQGAQTIGISQIAS